MEEDEKVYLNQDNFKLTLRTGVTLTGAITTIFKYIKPDGTEGQFTATIVDTEHLFYEFLQGANELDVVGIWKFWTHVTFADNRKAPGIVYELRIWEEGR